MTELEPPPDQSWMDEVALVERDDRRIWPIVVSVGASVLSAILAATLCLTISARNAERGREARAQLVAVQKQQQASVCAIVVALDDNYNDSPPTTDLGRRNAASMDQLRVALGCPKDKE